MSLQVTHERADMQRHLWVKAPLHAELDGVAHEVAEWSLGAIALPSPPSGFEVGRQVALRITLPFQGFDIGFATTGDVTSIAAANGRTVIAFRDLGQREHDLLAHFVEQLVRGRMTAVGDTIARLDTPFVVAEPASANVAVRSSARLRRPLRAAAITTAYSAAGIAVLGYLGTLLYTNFYWLEAPTSEITAPVQSLVSLGDGVVSWTTFKPGDRVKAGEVVLKLADSVLEREIEQAEIGIRERENKLAFVARRFENEKRRLGALASLSSLKSVHTGAEIDALNVKLQAAMRELKQLPSTALGPLAQVRQRIVSLQQGINLKGLDRNARANLSRETAGSLEFVGQTVVGEQDNLAAQIELAEADIAIAQSRYQSYLNQRDRLSLRAPFDGILRALPHADTATVRKGDVAAIIERSESRTVTAYLRQDQLLRVQLGAPAIVHVPATRRTFKATVTEIDPVRSGHVGSAHNNSGPGNQPRRDDGMAAVRLTLNTTGSSGDLNVYADGLPAVTTIGLATLPRAWSAAAASTATATVAAAAPAPPADGRGWVSRALSMIGLSGRARVPQPMGG